MAEIIKGKFGNKKQESVSEIKKPVEEDLIERATIISNKILDFLLITDYVMSQEVAATVTKDLQILSNSELVEMAENSTENDWSKNPLTFMPWLKYWTEDSLILKGKYGHSIYPTRFEYV